MSRELQGAVLLLVGVVTLRISWGTAYLNYVKESMRPWLLLSGGVLVVLGVLATIDAFRDTGGSVDDEPDSHGADGDGGGDGGGTDDHAHHGPRSAWLLFLPIITLFVIAPPALGAYAASLDTTNAAPRAQVLPPLPPGDPVPMYLSDFVTRAVWEGGASLEGRTVELTGFVLDQDAGPWLLARLQIACCAADAFASKVAPVEVPPEFENLPENAWVTVTGEWVPDDSPPSAETIPALRVTSIRRVAEPTNPYD